MAGDLLVVPSSLVGPRCWRSDGRHQLAVPAGELLSPSQEELLNHLLLHPPKRQYKEGGGGGGGKPCQSEGAAAECNGNDG